MSKKPMRIDRKTIITFNDKEQTASFYTCNTQMIKKLKEVAESFPAETEIEHEDEFSITATLPKTWIKLSTPRRLSNEQRDAARARMKKNRTNNR